MLREEEIKWYQRAKVEEYLEVDSNTSYFYLVANGKHRKSRIFQLQDGEHIIEGDETLKKHITSYYKKLFGPPVENLVSMDESWIEALIQKITEKEVKETFFRWNTIRHRGLMVSL
jgi:hypothetical protein